MTEHPRLRQLGHNLDDEGVLELVQSMESGNCTSPTDGEVDFNEFFFQLRRKYAPKRSFKPMFGVGGHRADLGGASADAQAATAADAKEALQLISARLTQGDARSIFREWDENRDGFITKEEFKLVSSLSRLDNRHAPASDHPSTSKPTATGTGQDEHCN